MENICLPICDFTDELAEIEQCNNYTIYLQTVESDKSNILDQNMSAENAQPLYEDIKDIDLNKILDLDSNNIYIQPQAGEENIRVLQATSNNEENGKQSYIQQAPRTGDVSVSCSTNKVVPNFEQPEMMQVRSTQLLGHNVISKAGGGDSWKSKEARRPKAYNCSACNKWYTSSGYLKRHYNTTLHKTAVKQIGVNDPVSMRSHHQFLRQQESQYFHQFSNEMPHQITKFCTDSQPSFVRIQNSLSGYSSVPAVHEMLSLQDILQMSDAEPTPVLHECVECNKTFNKACYLTQHNNSHHSGDKPYKCQRCGKRFTLEYLHQEHLQKHAGEKPYKCDQCPKQFNHKTDLQRHMCLHSGRKPFACDFCNKGFIRKDHMLKHNRTHKKKAGQ